MKILLIGHSIVDHIEGNTGDLIYPGGIYYSLLGMLSVKNDKDEIFLLTGIDQKHFQLFKNFYSKSNLDYSYQISDIPEVILKVNVDKEREEVYKNISTQLSFEKISDWDQFDGILINMITGFDISVDQLNTVRKNFNGAIYFDVHTLSRGVDNKMKREFRPIVNANDWLIDIDILQANENEVKTLQQGNSEFVIARKILNCGPKILIITKGKKGTVAYYKANGDLQRIIIPSVKVKAVNKIGCGDIFGAVFFYSYLCQKDISDSLKAANSSAALASSIKLTENPEQFVYG